MVRKLPLIYAFLLLLSGLVVFQAASNSGVKDTPELGALSVAKESGRHSSIKGNLHVRPGDLILIHGSTWVDVVIRKITGSRYTHVAGVVKTNQAIDILPFTTVGYKNLSSYAGKADVFTCDKLSDEQRKRVVAYVTQKVGTGYDYGLIAWEASRYIFNWVWPYQSGPGELCSTFWADAYRQAGVELCPNISFPSPADLAASRILRKVWSY